MFSKERFHWNTDILAVVAIVKCQQAPAGILILTLVTAEDMWAKSNPTLRQTTWAVCNNILYELLY